MTDRPHVAIVCPALVNGGAVGAVGFNHGNDAPTALANRVF